MKSISMKHLLMALIVVSASVSARGDLDSLAIRQDSNAPSTSISSPLSSLQSPAPDQQLNMLQGQWGTGCLVSGQTSSEEVVSITGNTLRRVFGVVGNTTCQAPPDVLGVQVGRITIGREISSGLFEIDWKIEQATFTPLTPAGAADLNANGGFCGFDWGVNITRDVTACLGPFVNQYSVFTVNNTRFVWSDRTANQPGTTPENRSTDINASTSYTRE